MTLNAQLTSRRPTSMHISKVHSPSNGKSYELEQTEIGFVLGPFTLWTLERTFWIFRPGMNLMWPSFSHFRSIGKTSTPKISLTIGCCSISSSQVLSGNRRYVIHLFLSKHPSTTSRHLIKYRSARNLPSSLTQKISCETSTTLSSHHTPRLLHWKTMKFSIATLAIICSAAGSAKAQLPTRGFPRQERDQRALSPGGKVRIISSGSSSGGRGGW